MKVCIYGAGAMGGWTGHRLAWAGCSVSPVARGATLAALQMHRLQLHQGGQRTSQAVAPSANPAVVSEQIQTDIWFKLWGNVTVNPISALTGATTDLVMNDALVRGFISSVMLEAKEIGGRIGITLPQQPEDRHAVTRKLGAFKTSMLRDVEAGKPVELDALVAVARLQAQVKGPY